jgi:hypothetical protein
MPETASFPAAVPTDADLLFARDRAETTLSAGIDASTLTVPLSSGARFFANMLITVGSEQMRVESVAGNTATIAADGRGWNGTTAATHASGASVRGQIGAYYHNRLAAEVQSIITALGVRLSNIGVWSHLHNFSAQTPGGSLVAGSNTITLSPVPAGVNGSNAAHYLYITGGTGTPEPVLITGGTAVSGAASGTVIVTCVNTHSGAWTIQSATAGIQEALATLPTAGGTVLIKRGTHTIYAPVTVRGSAIRLQGEGRNTTNIYSEYLGGPLVFFDGTNSSGGLGDCNEACDLTIRGANVSGSNYGLHCDNQSFGHFNRLAIVYTPGGLKITGETNSFSTRYREINIVGIRNDGIQIDALPAGGNFDDITIGGDSTSGSNGIHIIRSEGSRFSNVYTIYCGNGLLINPSSTNVYWTELVNCYFDGNFASGFGVNPSGTGEVIGLKCTHVTAAATAGATVPGTGTGFFFGNTGTIAGVRMSDSLAINNSGEGFYLVGGSDYDLNNCIATQNGTASSNAHDALVIYASNVEVRGGSYAGVWDQPNTQRNGIAIDSSAANVRISNAVVTPNATGGITNGSSTTEIRDCRGYNPVGLGAITVGASPYTYTSGASPEIVYIQGGTVTEVARPGSFVIANTSIPAGQSLPVVLPPRSSVIVTYSVAPTMFKDVQ